MLNGLQSFMQAYLINIYYDFFSGEEYMQYLLNATPLSGLSPDMAIINLWE